jgi:hypothetical protein
MRRMSSWRIRVCSGLLALGIARPAGNLFAQGDQDSSRASPSIVGVFQLPRISLSRLGNPSCSEAAVQKARRNGLKFDDLLSI